MLMKHQHGKPGLAADAQASRGAHAPSRVPTGALTGRFPQRRHFNPKPPNLTLFNAIQPCSTVLFFFGVIVLRQRARFHEPQPPGLRTLLCATDPRAVDNATAGQSFPNFKPQTLTPPSRYSGWVWLSTQPAFPTLNL
jgi:hypothetical protein